MVPIYIEWSGKTTRRRWDFSKGWKEVINKSLREREWSRQKSRYKGSKEDHFVLIAERAPGLGEGLVWLNPAALLLRLSFFTFTLAFQRQ